MQELDQKLTEIVESLLPPHLFLLELIIKGTGRLKLEAILDGDEGVTISECAEISRKVGKILEEEGLMDAPYELFVSSPGVDRALKLNRQYPKNIGRSLELKLQNGESCTAKLVQVTEKGLDLEEQTIVKEGKKKKKVVLNHHFDFEEIVEAKVQVSFK